MRKANEAGTKARCPRKKKAWGGGEREKKCRATRVMAAFTRGETPSCQILLLYECVVFIQNTPSPPLKRKEKKLFFSQMTLEHFKNKTKK